MTGREASLIARMQVALVGEGVLHSVHTPEQQLTDQEMIFEAVNLAWDELKGWERNAVRYWRTG